MEGKKAQKNANAPAGIRTQKQERDRKHTLPQETKGRGSFSNTEIRNIYPRIYTFAYNGTYK